MFELIDDTIVAVSSAAGHAPRGIVRLSGPGALGIGAGLFSDEERLPLAERDGFRRFAGRVLVEDGLSAPAELYLFRAPRSYTRQDLIELHTVGSPALLAMVVDGALARGARLAQPGEFTARAFLTGAMDLAEAESVAAVIRAQTDAQLRSAERLRGGELGRRTSAWLDKLAEIAALVEADIDFAEEPIEFITPAELRSRLSALRAEIEELLREAERAERFDVLPTVLLVGPANAGKSSLLNALSGLDRAIASAVAGTTRDILSAPLDLPGLDCLLLDGAGLTQSDDALIRAAQSMTRATAARVDLLCLVLDIAAGPDGHALDILRRHSERGAVIAANKSDLLDAGEAEARRKGIEAFGFGPAVATSARTGEGVDQLKRVIRDQLGSGAGPAEDRAILISARQREALGTACAALGRAIAEAAVIGETIDRADVIALELREALDAVGSVCGSVTTEDMLGKVFANFCIGK